MNKFMQGPRYNSDDPSPEMDAVDICYTIVSEKPPTLPLRQELPSLGVEVIYRAKGQGEKASRHLARDKVRTFRQEEMKHDWQHQPVLVPPNPQAVQNKIAQRRQVEQKLKTPVALSYETYAQQQQQQQQQKKKHKIGLRGVACQWDHGVHALGNRNKNRNQKEEYNQACHDNDEEEDHEPVTSLEYPDEHDEYLLQQQLERGSSDSSRDIKPPSPPAGFALRRTRADANRSSPTSEWVSTQAKEPVSYKAKAQPSNINKTRMQSILVEEAPAPRRASTKPLSPRFRINGTKPKEQESQGIHRPYLQDGDDETATQKEEESLAFQSLPGASTLTSFDDDSSAWNFKNHALSQQQREDADDMSSIGTGLFEPSTPPQNNQSSGLYHSNQKSAITPVILPPLLSPPRGSPARGSVERSPPRAKTSLLALLQKDKTKSPQQGYSSLPPPPPPPPPPPLPAQDPPSRDIRVSSSPKSKRGNSYSKYSPDRSSSPQENMKNIVSITPVASPTRRQVESPEIPVPASPVPPPQAKKTAGTKSKISLQELLARDNSRSPQRVEKNKEEPMYLSSPTTTASSTSPGSNDNSPVAGKDDREIAKAKKAIEAAKAILNSSAGATEQRNSLPEDLLSEESSQVSAVPSNKSQDIYRARSGIKVAQAKNMFEKSPTRQSSHDKEASVTSNVKTEQKDLAPSPPPPPPARTPTRVREKTSLQTLLARDRVAPTRSSPVRAPNAAEEESKSTVDILEATHAPSPVSNQPPSLPKLNHQDAEAQKGGPLQRSAFTKPKPSLLLANRASRNTTPVSFALEEKSSPTTPTKYVPRTSPRTPISADSSTSSYSSGQMTPKKQQQPETPTKSNAETPTRPWQSTKSVSKAMAYLQHSRRSSSKSPLRAQATEQRTQEEVGALPQRSMTPTRISWKEKSHLQALMAKESSQPVSTAGSAKPAEKETLHQATAATSQQEYARKKSASPAPSVSSPPSQTNVAAFWNRQRLQHSQPPVAATTTIPKPEVSTFETRRSPVPPPQPKTSTPSAAKPETSKAAPSSRAAGGGNVAKMIALYSKP